jgi:hypothetical protein
LETGHPELAESKSERALEQIMTKKTDYTSDEWQLLIDAPTLAGLAVMVAGKSGLGTMKEAVAVTQGTLSSGDAHPNVELVQAIIEARTKGGEKSSAETMTNNPYQGLGREKFVEVAAEKCTAASELLGRKATAEEALAFKAWVLSIADRVAKAAREGGFLGVGGTQVSEEEVATVDRIKASLSA